MWGTPVGRQESQAGERFIPTHVGNSLSTCVPSILTAVHPHACGELEKEDPCACCPVGSSPRMWGTLTGNWKTDQGARFIPTHVGNSPDGPPPGSSRSVHPHACGELMSFALKAGRSPGSSPRMWGTRHRFMVQAGACRFIPTHVGNSSVRFNGSK